VPVDGGYLHLRAGNRHELAKPVQPKVSVAPRDQAAATALLL